MPAYRSDAEGEIRTAVVDRLRQIRPEARIMHEVNASSFGNRIDVLAVDRAEIIAVEIKSAKDKLDRLDGQVKAMKGVAHHVIAALHEKFYVEQRTNEWRSEYERDGLHYCLAPPDNRIARGYANWRYPEHAKDRWFVPDIAVQQPLPAKALDMLWHGELHAVCRLHDIGVTKRATVGFMTKALRWQLTGRDLTLSICAALRARVCIEADEPIEWRDAA
jgi:hypothetical protein